MFFIFLTIGGRYFALEAKRNSKLMFLTFHRTGYASLTLLFHKSSWCWGRVNAFVIPSSVLEDMPFSGLRIFYGLVFDHDRARKIVFCLNNTSFLLEVCL